MSAPVDSPPLLDATAVLLRLADLGPPSGIRSESPELAADAMGFDRVLLTSLSRGMLIAEALYHGPGNAREDILARLRERPVEVGYPLVEGEILRRRRAQVIRPASEDGLERRAFSDVLGWADYVIAPIVLDGKVLGFFHADRMLTEGTVDEADALSLSSFALCFGIVYERAVLRHRLRVQRQEMRQVASWADARTGELGDRSITLGADEASETAEGPDPSSAGESALRDLLTRRELEVLKLMVGGETNAKIAKELVVSEGTVKFHVKNILRKLHASNRAEATSRYLRLTLSHGGMART